MTHDEVAPESVRAHDGTVEVSLAAELASVPAARHFVQDSWTDLADDVLDDVALIVTELVANAVKHGQPDIVLKLRMQPFAVDVAVLDHGPSLPPSAATPAGTAATSGRGLSIVDQLASSWGVDALADNGGKSVWATVRSGEAPPEA